MDIEIDIRKTIEENAKIYFEKAKKSKRKIDGARTTIEKAETLVKEHKEKEKHIPKGKIKEEWFEKFRWFKTSEDTLVIGGRDAGSNEVIVKKHMEKNDVVFHTQMPGSPFVILKEGKELSKESYEEAAQFCATYSKAWKGGLGFAEVFYVNPDQVTKHAMGGAVGKGAFMIYGKKNFLKPKIELAIGNYDGKVMAGPYSAIKNHCKKFSIILPGNIKTSDIAKKLAKKLELTIDNLVKVIPPGGARIK